MHNSFPQETVETCPDTDMLCDAVVLHLLISLHRLDQSLMQVACLTTPGSKA